jgi:3',5'-nucleoside bisphosphate phosphatase
MTDMTFLTNLSHQGVDLHTHTRASDGIWSPQSLVETALERKIGILSVSDHDTIQSLKPVQVLARKHGLRFIPGVEVAIELKNSVYHLLLFGFDPEDAALNAMLDDTRHRQWLKKQMMAEVLKKRGYNLPETDKNRYTDSTSPIYELASDLVSENEELSFAHAWDLCREVEPAFHVAQPAAKAINIGRAAGAIPVLAHPGRSGTEISAASDDTLKALVEIGLEGIEAYYYAHSPAMMEHFLRFAQKHRLVVSCGSDSHDDRRKPLPWNPELCRELLERLNVGSSSVAA